MKSKLLFLVLVVALFSIGAYVVFARSTQQEYTGKKWEYAYLTYLVENSPNTDGKPLIYVYTSNPEQDILLDETIASLQLPPIEIREIRAPDPHNIPTVLDYLGSLGWEVASTNLTGGLGEPLSMFIFILKRPIN